MTTVAVEPKPISRREFLYYMWGASGALALSGACGLSVWYALPDRQIMPANGYIQIPMAAIPPANQQPILFRNNSAWDSFWLVNQGMDLTALIPLCPKDKLLFKWVDLNNRFECPGCGSKYRLDGSYIEGAAPRSLDRHTIYVTTPTQHRQTPEDGSPVDIYGATEIMVHTRVVIKGRPRPSWIDGMLE